jgi:hypothetical protein
MVKSLHSTLKVLLMMACLAAPATMVAQDVQQSQVEMEQNQVTIVVSGFSLRVKNAEGQTLEIFSLTGEKVYGLQHIDSPSKAVNLSQLRPGYYIVKIGKFTRKVYLPK